jgi:hypothetical protein
MKILGLPFYLIFISCYFLQRNIPQRFQTIQFIQI